MPLKTVIAVDLDEVLCPFFKPLKNFVNKTTKNPIKQKPLKQYIFSTYFNIPDNEMKYLVRDFYESNEAHSLKPLTNSYKSMEFLTNIADLYIVTGRQHYAKDITYEFIDKYYPNLFKDIIMTNSYSLNGKEEQKFNVCNSLNANIIIDDNEKLLKDCLEFSSTTPLLYGDYDWTPKNTNINRILSWHKL